MKKKNSTHFPSMAVCCATLFSPTKGKSTWGVEIQQDNPILVDGRPLLPSLPSHRTFYADIRSRLGPSSSMAVRCSLRCLPIHHTLSADTLRGFSGNDDDIVKCLYFFSCNDDDVVKCLYFFSGNDDDIVKCLYFFSGNDDDMVKCLYFFSGNDNDIVKCLYFFSGNDDDIVNYLYFFNGNDDDIVKC